MRVASRCNRRQLLVAGLGAGAALSLSGQQLGWRRLQAVNLVAERTGLVMVDGRQLPGWRLRDLADSGPGGLAAGLVGSDNEDWWLTVGNELEVAVRLEIPGIGSGPRIEPGTTGEWRLSRLPVGSYLLATAVDDGSTLSTELGLAMGLLAPLVVFSEDGIDDALFDRQYVLMLSDLDDRLQQSLAAGGTPSLEVFEPNYFFMNGLSYPDTIGDEATRVVAQVGERVLIRLINGGLLARSMHSHGYHFEVLERDRVPESTVIHKDTVAVFPGECVDILVSVHQPGLYPLHDHYVPAVTANGAYVNPVGGALTLIDAS